jgi:hypothetical protein
MMILKYFRRILSFSLCSAGIYYFHVVIQNIYRYDVIVTTTLKDTRYQEIVIPGRQKHTIDIKVASLDPVEITARNPSGQPELVNDGYSQRIPGTISREAPQNILIGSAGKIFLLFSLLFNDINNQT